MKLKNNNVVKLSLSDKITIVEVLFGWLNFRRRFRW